PISAPESARGSRSTGRCKSLSLSTQVGNRLWTLRQDTQCGIPTRGLQSTADGLHHVVSRVKMSSADCLWVEAARLHEHLGLHLNLCLDLDLPLVGDRIPR